MATEPANSDQQIQIGLSLVSCALGMGVDSLASFPSLLAQDQLCHHLVSLLSSESVAVVTASLRCCFLIINSLWLYKAPGLITEPNLNYDSSIYNSNLFEDPVSSLILFS